MKKALISFAAVVALSTASVSAQTLPIRSPAADHSAAEVIAHRSTQSVEAAQLREAAKQIGAVRKLTWNCQDALGAPRTKASTDIWSLPQSVGYRVWVAKKWIAVAKGCHQTLSSRTIPYTSDWLTAVQLVQRIYPGTEQWLLYISHREGGYGRFVMNTQGSGAGGWMQFMASTYYAHNDAAFADAKARGFILPEGVNQWTHPLGQAITAGYMRYTHQDGCHWCL